MNKRINRLLVRCSDVILAAVGLLLSAPALVAISILIFFTSEGPVFYRQIRVGKGGKEFRLLKFRTMKVHADRQGRLTVGGRDSRITPVGYWLRRFKLDELPQLFQVVTGTMSLVGPRPEVPEYVALYSDEQRKVLAVRPGITDLASLAYFNENEQLSKVEDPEKYYREVIMPDKIRLNMAYVDDPVIGRYLTIIIKTAGRILSLK